MSAFEAGAEPRSEPARVLTQTEITHRALHRRYGARTVSFDIFLQAFEAGRDASGDANAVTRVLSPYFEQPPDNGFVRLVTSDGEADVYGIGEPSASLMFNHVSGKHAWDLMFEVARSAGLVIMPVGCPTLVCRPEQEQDLPEAFRDAVRLVTSGADILRAIREG